MMVDAAERLGLTVEDRSHWGVDLVRIVGEGRTLWLRDGRIVDGLGYVADWLCARKDLTKHVFAELDIPAPCSIVFRHPDELGGWHDGRPWVCKPIDGTNGEGVGMGLRTSAELEAHLERNSATVWMLEEQVSGRDLRLQAVGGRLVAACVREPARVVGDGIADVAALVDRHNALIRSQNHDNFLAVDHDTRELLREQVLTLAAIPAAGRVVQLKRVSNMSQGGIAVDVTDEVHPTYAAWVRRIARHLDLDLFALDVIAEDHTRDQGAACLEVNAQPQWLHHTFSERRTHDIAAMILAHTFGPPPPG